MGFGSGGGGFTPSPNNVPGSTQAGTDKDTDLHQFTGSVDITGSLTLNGSAVTGGGGGGTPGGSDTQIQYNNGGAFGGASGLIYDDVNNRVGIGVADPDSKIEILSTTTQQKWSYDADSFATLTVADDSEVTVATGEAGNLILDAGGDIRLNAAGGDISFRENAEVKLIFDMDTAGGTTKIYSGVAGDDLIFGTAPGGAGNVLTIKDDGKVGLGLNDPDSTLEVRSTTTQQKWSYDDDHGFTITVGDDGETILAVSGTTVSPSPASDLVFDVSKGGDIFFRRSGDRLRFGISTGETIVQVDNVNTDLVYRIHPNGGLGAVGTEIARFDASGAGAFLMSGTISVPGGNAPINFRDTATNIHSPGANRLALTAPTLEVTGTLGLNGTSLASTAAELNLLDASGVTPTAASWAAVERIGVYDISGEKPGAGGTTYTLGTLPSGSVITDAYLDIHAVFTPVDGTAGEISIGIGTDTTFPIAGGSAAAILDFAPINALTNAGSAFNSNTTTGVLNLKNFGFGAGLAIASTVKKLPAQENVQLLVADVGAGNDGGLATSSAKLYIKYVVM